MTFVHLNEKSLFFFKISEYFFAGQQTFKHLRSPACVSRSTQVSSGVKPDKSR